ncbi:MAG: ABC-F family ATP-binding cassette domain-containing protein [Oligoflexia bacterium]|nr:ABC-F family ATP-binding cassette domain-containing protein [Oligoflexia bacterium]
MSILVNAYQLKKSFSSRPLFTGLTFSIESGERIGLIGPNGAGKSTLLRILAGVENLEEGSISLEKGLRIAYLEQVPSFNSDDSVQSSILGNVKDPHNWEDLSLANELISRLALPPAETLISSLSGGWKKRVALARELLKRPDLLLLDEPTNHLDIDGIYWLENYLSTARFSTLTVTHDRVFLQKVSNRIIELDRRNPGGLLQVKGDYLAYLKLKEETISAQEHAETKLKNTLRRESEWLARGAKARSTKQQARIERAYELEKEVEELGYRNQKLKLRIDFQEADKGPKKLIAANRISKSYGEKVVIPAIPPLDLLITYGSRIGLLGANGCGKTTLLKVLIGEEETDTGEVFRSDQLQVAWFEQNRECLDPNLTILKTVCPDGDYVDYKGAKVHAIGYLSRFLFNKEQLDIPVGRLSGGEQARLLIARLMLKKANLLVLDEPTNDLDLATLDVLQDVLQDFRGAVILVSHDRYFLDQVASQILAFDESIKSTKGSKQILSFEGLNQWEEWYKKRDRERDLERDLERDTDRVVQTPQIANTASTAKKKKKLSFNEQKEFEGMEEAILHAEELLAKLIEESSRPESANNPTLLTEISKKMDLTQKEIDRLYARWTELADLGIGKG